MKTRLIFVRHAEAEGNLNRVFHGWTDADITEKGHKQAQKAAERLSEVKIDVIYSSSLKRTLKTAEYIARVKNLPILKTDKLKEINGGDWEGKRWDELTGNWPEEYYTWENKPHIHRMPNGESMQEFQSRLIKEVEYIIDNNKGKDICVVTHGTAIKALMCYFQGCELDEMLNIKWYDNTSITMLDYDDGKFEVLLEGDISHLGDELGTVSKQEWWNLYIKEFEKRNKKEKEERVRSLKTVNEKLVNWLFETHAVRVCPQNKPFWYTSGTIGPYYINTHFLYGSKEKANSLLETIDREKADAVACPLKVLEATLENYESDDVYKGLIDEMIDFIKKNMDLNMIDFISGGERRDWFFSMIISHFLEKPHITIYKDLKLVVMRDNTVNESENLKGKRVLHIADLITEASSYERAWIPAIKNSGGDMKWSLVVVDRMQGGAELLLSQGVKPFAMINIDSELFDKALKLGYIDGEQYKMLAAYMHNPRESMRNFLLSNPDFLKSALNSDERTRKRAEMCLEKKPYGDL